MSLMAIGASAWRRRSAGAPVYLEFAVGRHTTTLTEHVIPLPPAAVGDKLILQLTHGNANSGEYTNVTPAGWRRAGTRATSGIRLTLFERTIDGTEGGTVTVVVGSSTRSTWIWHRIKVGTYSGDCEVAFAHGATGTSCDPPALSPPWGAKNTLWLAVYAQRNNTRAPPGYPLPNGHAYVDTASTGAAHNNSASCWAVEQAATLDPGEFIGGASSNSQWAAATIAIAPP